jgi:hypothetical protein
MKPLNRIVLLNLTIAYIVVLVFFPFNLSGEVKNIDTRELLIGMWVLLTIMSSIYLWIFSFIHWNKQKFTSNAFRVIWFLVILIGGFGQVVGPYLYNIVVVELRKTIIANG